MTQIPQVPRHRSNTPSATTDAVSDSWLAIPDFTLVAEVGTCPAVAAKSDAVLGNAVETPSSVAMNSPVVSMENIQAPLDTPMLMSDPPSGPTSNSSSSNPTNWPLDASIQVHPERPGLRPVLANLGSYTGLVGHLVRMSTSDWRRTVVILGVGMLAILSWMRGGSSAKPSRKLTSPQVTSVPDVSSIEQLGQEPLRAPTPAKKPPALPQASAASPSLGSRLATEKVDDADLFRVKSLEVSASPSSEGRQRSSDGSEAAPKPDWPAFQSPSGSKVSRTKSSRADGDEETSEPRVATRERRSRWGRLAPEHDADAAQAEDEETISEEEVRVVAQRRATPSADEYPSTDAEEYPPYDMPATARRSSKWSR